MATNRRIDIEMRVLANTEQAKKQFENLQKSLTTAAGRMDISAGFGKNFMTEVHAAQNEVAKLQAALQSAYNVETGKLDFTKFQSSMKSLGLDAEHVADTLRSMGPAGLNALKQLTIGVQSAEIPVKKLNTWVEKLATTLRNTIRWQISATALNTFVGAVQTAYGYAQDLNSSLNDIRIVTGYSSEKMAEFAENANKAAKSLSASTLAYTDAALIFYQQGLSDKEVLERTNATIKMSNVTGEQAEQVSSYMTAIWNNFADGSRTLEYYADVITELGARTAASSEEIAHSMEKFAAVGETVGLSYEYAAAAVTTVIDKTRLSADVVGTSFKTLFARLEGLSLGETLDDGTTLTKYSKALATVGVNIKDQTGQLKEMDQILDELGAKWEMLSSDQQVALAQTVGGVRQYTQLISLMENYDTFKENVNAARDSEGTLNKQQRIFEESWEGASKRLRASWEAIYSDIIEDDFFIELTDSATKFLDVLDKVFDNMGGLKGLLTQLLPIVTTIFNKQITNGLKSFGHNMASFAPGFKQKKQTEQQDMVASLFQGRLSKEQQLELRYTEIIRDNVNELDEIEKDRLFNLKEILKVQQQVGDEISRENQLRNGERPTVRADSATGLTRANELVHSISGSLILDGGSDDSRRSADTLTGLKVAQRYADTSQYTPEDFYKGLSYINQHETLGPAFRDQRVLVNETLAMTNRLLQERQGNINREIDVSDIDAQLEELQENFGQVIEELLIAQARETQERLSQEFNQAWMDAPGSNDIDFRDNYELYEEMRQRAVDGVYETLDEASTQRADAFDVDREIRARNKQSVNPQEALNPELHIGNYAERMVGLANDLMYASAASNILTNAISQLGDDSISTEDKIGIFSQSLMSLGVQLGGFLQTDLGKGIAKSLKLDELVGGIKNKITTLMGSSGMLGSVLSAVPYVAIAAAVAKVGYDIIHSVIDTQLANEQRKYSEGLQKTAEWRQENAALIEAIDNYHKLREEVDETGEYSLEFKDHILDTAEALGIENAALLAQADAYDLLKSKIEDAEGALEEEARANSKRDFANFQGLAEIGTSRAHLGENILRFFTAAPAFSSGALLNADTMSGGFYAGDEGTFLNAVRDLGIENGISTSGNTLTYDFSAMSQADQVKFAEFLADVQNNPGAYGLGENSEFLKNISAISEDMETVASQLSDSLDYLVTASAREQGVEIRDRNNSDDSIFGYNADLEELKLALKEEYGLSEEDAYTSASQALNELYSGTVAAQSAVLKEYAEATGQDLNDVVASLEGYSEDDLANIITAMGANAAATHAILENITDTTDQLEYINALVGQLDVTTLITSLDSIYEFIEKLTSGDTVKSEDLETLASQMGFNSVEQFLEAFSGSFTKVANDKYIFTGIAEDFTRGFEDYTSRQLNDYMNSGISYSELIDQIGDGKTFEEWNEEWTAAGNNATLDQNVLSALDILDPAELNMQGYQLDEETFINHLAELMSVEREDAQAAYDELIRNGTLTASEEGVFIDYDNIAVAQQQYNSDLEANQAAALTASEKVQALSTFEGLEDEAARWESGDRTAFEEQLVTEYTSLEELQDLYEEGYISAEKYHKSLGATALQEAENLDIDSKKLAEHANFLAENNQYLQDNLQSSYDVALANERVNKALEDLYANMENYTSILNEGRVDSEEYQQTVSALSDDLQNMFNYDEAVSEDFILEHLTEIQAAADGDISAVNSLQIAFAQMRVSEEDAALGMSDIWNEIEAMDWDNLEIGVTMDTAPAIQSLAELMIQAGMSADAIQDTLNSLGWEAELVTETVNGKTIVTGVVSKNSHYIGSNRRGLNTDTKKGKSSGKTSKKDEKEFKDEFERYYKITRQIKDQQDATERLNKAKERAFGKAKLEYLDQEADSMQREIDLQKEYLDEIRGYYASDKGNLEAFGATFDENGVLTNYEQLINAELARYNQAVEAYNANQDEAAFESAEKRFNYFKEVLKQYDETNQLYQEQLDNLTDMQNKWYDMALQKTQLKVEMEIDIDERDLELLEYALDRIEKKAFATAEAMAKITQSVGDTLDKQKIYENALEEILSRHGINSIESANNLSDEEIANLGFTQEEIDALVEYNSNLLDTQKEMDKLQDEILNGPLKAFKEWNEEFDYQEDKIQRNIDLLNQYRNIADLIFTNSSAVGQEYIMSLMTNTYDSMVLGVDAARLELEANQSALEKARQSYEEAVANGAGEETLNTLNKNLREMEKAVADSEDDMLKKTEEALKQAEELLRQTIENAKNDFKELTSITDWDMTQFDRLKSLDDEYLDDYQKIYEFAKLTRDINNSIDDTDTIRGKERLKEITQEIADIEAEGREVSQYEVDALRAKYELRLAEIALEDAQNAKSTVRMNRDNEGNWSYVYTADDDNVDKARQNYEDKLYEYQKLNSEFIKNQQQNFLKLEQEYTDAMQKIAEDSSLSKEDKEARLQETQAYYQRMAEIMSDQLGIALNKNSELYNKDWLDYSKNTGYKISMEEEYQTKLDDTYTGHLQPNIDSATQLLAQFTESATGDGGYLPTIINALDDFEVRQDEVLQAAGTSLMTYADDMQRTAEDIETTMDDAAAGLVEDFDTIMEKMSEINVASFDGLRNSITDAISSVNDLVAAYERLSSAASAAQDSSIAAGDSAMRSFPGGGGGNGGGAGGGVSSTLANNPASSSGSTRSGATLSEFLWHFYRIRNVPQGSGMWAAIKQELVREASSDLVSDRNFVDFVRAIASPNNNYGSADEINNLIRNSSFGASSIRIFREWAKQKFSNIYSNYSFDTGGYTGAWGTEGRLAFLHQKELVLNAEDTENMLNIVQMVRNITSAIDTRASLASVASIGNDAFGRVNTGVQTLDQNVHIEANFPNVTDHNEIELALSNLVNQAAQYANRKN